MSLWTVEDIAEFFAVGRRTVAEKWIYRPDFPQPLFAPSRRTRRWDRSEVIAWAMPKGRKKSAQPAEIS